MPKCLSCNKREAIKIEPYGFVYCNFCQRKHRVIYKPGTIAELTSSEIKEHRKIYEKDIVQAFRDGELSKEYVEAYPDRVKSMIREGNLTPEEVKSAKYTWNENSYYNK